MDSMIRHAVEFYAQSPTGQYDDLAELALKYVGAVMDGQTAQAQDYMELFESLCNDD